MRRGPPSVEQAGLGQHHDTRAEGHHARAALTDTLQGLDQGSRHGGIDRAPARHHHEIRLVEKVESAFGHYDEAAGGSQRPRLDAAHRVPIPRRTGFGTRQGEHFVGDAELEGAEAIIGQHRDAGTSEVFGAVGCHDLDAR